MYKVPAETNLFLLEKVLKHNFDVNDRVFESIDTLTENYDGLSRTSISVIKETIFSKRIDNGETIPEDLDDLDYCIWCIAKLEVESQNKDSTLSSFVIPLRIAVLKIANLLDHIKLCERMTEQNDCIIINNSSYNEVVSDNANHKLLLKYIIPTLRYHLSQLTGITNNQTAEEIVNRIFSEENILRVAFGSCELLISELMSSYAITTKELLTELKNKDPSDSVEYMKLTNKVMTAFNWCKIMERNPPKAIADKCDYYFENCLNG